MGSSGICVHMKGCLCIIPLLISFRLFQEDDKRIILKLKVTYRQVDNVVSSGYEILFKGQKQPGEHVLILLSFEKILAQELIAREQHCLLPLLQ